MLLVLTKKTTKAIAITTISSTSEKDLLIAGKDIINHKNPS